MTAREAMAYGRPVVATRVGGLADLGPGAVLVAPGSARMLRAALERLLGSADERERHGTAARAAAEERWSNAVTARELVAVYDAAVTRHHDPRVCRAGPDPSRHCAAQHRRAGSPRLVSDEGSRGTRL